MITNEQIQSALTELYTERETLEDGLRQVKTAIEGLEAYMQHRGGNVATQPDTQNSRPTNTQSVGTAIHDILRRSDGFVSVAELKSKVATAYPPVAVKRLSNAIYATLSRNTKRGRYVRENGMYRWPSPEMRFN